MLNDIQKQSLLTSIRTVKDFPKAGIDYRDITTLLANSEYFTALCDHLADYVKDQAIDVVVGLESRGFIFASVLAYLLGVSFVPIRKKGKLPYHPVSEKYGLEYGVDVIEIHRDAFAGLKDPRVLLIDDILATGGTAKAAISLIKKVGGNPVMACFVLTLKDLPGKVLIEKELPVYSVLVD